MSVLFFGLLFAISLQDGMHYGDFLFLLLMIVFSWLEFKEPESDIDEWMGY